MNNINNDILHIPNLPLFPRLTFHGTDVRVDYQLPVLLIWVQNRHSMDCLFALQWYGGSLYTNPW
jgi:hypothetical protein